MPAFAESDTEQLLARAAAGDVRAGHEALVRHRQRLKRMLKVRTDERLAARLDESDLVQETLTEAAAWLPKYLDERPIPFYPWLRSIAERKLIDAVRHHRRAKRALEREEVLGLPDHSALDLAARLICPNSSPSQSAVRREVRERVRNALDDLDERDREVLVLYHLEKLSIAEVAAVLGISEEAAKSRRRRALLRLSRSLHDLRQDFES